MACEVARRPLRGAEEAGAGRRELRGRDEATPAAEPGSLRDRVPEHALRGENAGGARGQPPERLVERDVLDLDAGMPVGMPVDARCPFVGHAHRREASRAVACCCECPLDRPCGGLVVQRSEGGRLTGVIEDAGHARSQVELCPEPVEGGRRVTGDEHGVGGRCRPPRGRREHVARSRQCLGVERRVELLDVEAVLARQPCQGPARGGGDLGADPVPGQAGDDVGPPGGHRMGVSGDRGSSVELLSLGTPAGRTSGVVSVGVCACDGRVSVDLP